MPDALGWRKTFAVLAEQAGDRHQYGDHRHAPRASGIEDKIAGWGLLLYCMILKGGNRLSDEDHAQRR